MKDKQEVYLVCPKCSKAVKVLIECSKFERALNHFHSGTILERTLFLSDKHICIKERGIRK